MPCNGEHMNPTTLERDLSLVAYLIDELNGLPVEPSQYRSGMHPAVYGAADNALRDRLVPELCGLLKTVDVTKYSLEMQMWWRDHQAADAAREAKSQPVTVTVSGAGTGTVTLPLTEVRAPTHIPPLMRTVTGIEAEVCADIARRQKMGVKKYGTTLADNPAGEIKRLQHAYEEALDLANYLKWQIMKKQDEMSRTKQCAMFSPDEGVESMTFIASNGAHGGTVALRRGETLIVTKVLSK